MSYRCPRCGLERHMEKTEPCPLCGLSAGGRPRQTQQQQQRTVKPRKVYAKGKQEQRDEQSKAARAARDARRQQNIGQKVIS